MASETASFFEALADRGPEPLLGRTRATMRFDIVGTKRTDHWLVRIRDGAIDVSHADGDAECIVRADAEAFDAIASGRTNAMAAFLRGAVDIEGDPRLFVQAQRLFPAPVGMPEVAGDRAVGRRRS
jgi:putative sterol carrier protein